MPAIAASPMEAEANANTRSFAAAVTSSAFAVSDCKLENLLATVCFDVSCDDVKFNTASMSCRREACLDVRSSDDAHDAPP